MQSFLPVGRPVQHAAATAAEDRIARAEQRLAMLHELAELGMAMARDLTRRTVEPAEPAESRESTPRPEPRHDPANAFARISRAVRLTLVLEGKADEALSALRAGVAAELAGSSDGADAGHGILPRDYPSAHRNKVRDAIFPVINAELTELIAAQDMLDTLYERLIEGAEYDALSSGRCARRWRPSARTSASIRTGASGRETAGRRRPQAPIVILKCSGAPVETGSVTAESNERGPVFRLGPRRRSPWLRRSRSHGIRRAACGEGAGGAPRAFVVFYTKSSL